MRRPWAPGTAKSLRRALEIERAESEHLRRELTRCHEAMDDLHHRLNVMRDARARAEMTLEAERRVRLDIAKSNPIDNPGP